MNIPYQASDAYVTSSAEVDVHIALLVLASHIEKKNLIINFEMGIRL